MLHGFAHKFEFYGLRIYHYDIAGFGLTFIMVDSASLRNVTKKNPTRSYKGSNGFTFFHTTFLPFLLGSGVCVAPAAHGDL